MTSSDTSEHDDGHELEAFDSAGLVAALREWADRIEAEPDALVAFSMRFAFADDEGTLAVDSAWGGATWIFERSRHGGHGDPDDDDDDGDDDDTPAAPLSRRGLN